MRSRREMVATFSRPLPSYSLPFASSRIPSRFAVFVSVCSAHRRGRMVEGWWAASGEDKRTGLVLSITHVGQPKPYNNLCCRIAPPRLTQLMPLVASHYVWGGGRGKCESTCRCTLLDGRMMGVIQFLSVLSISRSYQSSCAYRHVPRSIPPILVSPTSLHDGFISSLT